MKIKHQFLKHFVAASVIGIMALPIHALAANKLIVKDAAGTTDSFVVTDTGFVGINGFTGLANAPTRPINLVGPTTSSTQFFAQTIANLNSGGGGSVFYHNRGTPGATTLPLAGDRIGYFLFGAYGGAAGTTPLNPAGINARADGDWSFTDGTTYSLPTYFSFETTSAANAAPRTEIARFASNGNVGVGTTAPTQKLDVNGAIRMSGTGTAPTCDATTRGSLWVAQGAAGVGDALQMCGKGTNNLYSWVTVFTMP